MVGWNTKQDLMFPIHHSSFIYNMQSCLTYELKWTMTISSTFGFGDSGKLFQHLITISARLHNFSILSECSRNSDKMSSTLSINIATFSEHTRFSKVIFEIAKNLDDCLLNFLGLSSTNLLLSRKLCCKSCRYHQELSNEYLQLVFTT